MGADAASTAMPPRRSDFPDGHVRYRILFSSCSRPPIDATRGPWHPDKALVLNWARWFARLGHDVQLESSTGKRSRIDA